MLWRNVWLLESSPEPRCGTPELPEQARVAIYTPGHVGDVLHVVPLVRALRSARPAADIVWVVGPWCYVLARRYPFASRVEVFSPAWFQYRRGGVGDSLFTQRSWGRALSAVDLFVSTSHADLSTLFVGRCFQPLHWIGRPPSFPLYPVAGREDLIISRKDVYEAEDHLQLLTPLGLQGGDSSLTYRVAEDERVAAQRILAAAGIASGAPYAVIAPGAGWAGKQWPTERWANVGDKLNLMGCAVVLVGTASERIICASIGRSMRAQSTNIAGSTGLAELAGVLEGARIWLGSDSGSMHIAAALGTPTVSLFGPTNPQKWAPRGAAHVALRAVEGCPSCIPWHPRARCVDGGRCMLAIGVQEVCDAAQFLLLNGRDARR
ncbi:MAG TPA: glycosyltransferase family 9 protein [Kiritimatiellia bacterium]|nr:glycosyltransferase family 9 protein [Kiritimatiellia bacterium]